MAKALKEQEEAEDHVHIHLVDKLRMPHRWHTSTSIRLG